jgi:hypothetical protein
MSAVLSVLVRRESERLTASNASFHGNAAAGERR